MTRELLVPGSSELEDLVSDTVKRANSYEVWELRSHFLYWTGLELDSGQKFFAKRHGSNMRVLAGDNEESAKLVFDIIIGETSLIFDCRSAIPGSMIYKSKLLSEIGEGGKFEQTVRDFMEQKPTPEEIVDISPETLKQKMVERREKEEIKMPDFLLNSSRKHGYQK